MEEMLRGGVQQNNPGIVGGYSLPKNSFSSTTMNRAVKVYVIEAAEFIREAISITLDSHQAIEVVGVHANGISALENILNVKPEIILASCDQETGFFEMIQALKTTLPSVPVIMLNERPSDSLIQRALNNGASGIITAKESVNEIADAIVSIKNGRKYFSPNLNQRIIASRNNSMSDYSSRKSLLSPREIEVLCCVAQGMKAKKIGSILRITAKTVERHKSNIMAKLGLNSQVDLAIYAIREGYVQI
ncbi:response regulator transcription factor [bacterium]|nr:response regulator transcription factor [bacterium]